MHPQVLGEALLSAGYLAYLGPLPGSARLRAEAGWTLTLEKRQIPMAPGFSLAESMGDPTLVRVTHTHTHTEDHTDTYFSYPHKERERESLAQAKRARQRARACACTGG